jgi:hypothetical protein
MRQLRSPLFLLTFLVSAAAARALIPASGPKPSPSVAGHLVSGYRFRSPRFAQRTSGDHVEQDATPKLLAYPCINAFNQYSSRTLSDKTDILALAYATATKVSVHGQTFTYDADGNLTNDCVRGVKL